ncbi:MFS transporter [Hyphomonadaceae bacterium ML37]|nr:MFS transporter [Hyphomonadaceae bacterium ML37]
MTTASQSPGAAEPAPPTTRYRAWVLFMLFIVYAFNFLDRQIISILAIPIREDLGLDDRQLGLLGGIAFAALYSTLGVPIAWLADRSNRTWIITISLTVWSGFTAVCGFAQNFWQLFAARVGVGVGEAGGVAPSYSLIADYFPPDARARALAIYSLGIPIGSAFGVVAGAQIAGGAIGEDLDWRAAFIIVGLAGVLIAPIFKLTMREPKRGGLDVKAGAAAAKLQPEPGEAASVGVPGEMGARIVGAPMRPGVMASITQALGSIAAFSGRARRSIFWWPYLFVFFAQLVVTTVHLFTQLPFILLLVSACLPALLLATAVRRMNDCGRSPLWLVVPIAVQAAGQYLFVTGMAPAGVLLGLAGFMTLVGFLAAPSAPDNAHGPSPVPADYLERLYKLANPGIPDVLAVLIPKRSFWLLVLGASCSSMMGYGVFFWVPSFFARSFQLDIISTGWLFGGILFVGGTLGILLGGVLGDLMGKGSKKMYAIVPAVAFFLAFPMYVAGTLAPTPLIGALIFIIPTGLGLAWLGPTLSAFQHLAPSNMRSMASAVFLLINNLLGIGVGVYVLGEISTLLTPVFQQEALRYSIMVGASLYAVAGVLFLVASRTIVRDWEK